MVHIVVLSAGPEGKEVVQAPGEFVTTVCIDSLEEAEHDPQVHGQNMQITRNSTPQNGRADRSETKNHDLNGRSVLSGKSEGSRVLVVDLVDVLVEKAVVHGAVHPVMPGILENEENSDLKGHLVDAREGNCCAETKELAHGVEEPDLRKLDGEVRKEDKKGTLPLLPRGGDLVL